MTVCQDYLNPETITLSYDNTVNLFFLSDMRKDAGRRNVELLRKHMSSPHVQQLPTAALISPQKEVVSEEHRQNLFSIENGKTVLRLEPLERSLESHRVMPPPPSSVFYAPRVTRRTREEKIRFGVRNNGKSKKSPAVSASTVLNRLGLTLEGMEAVEANSAITNYVDKKEAEVLEEAKQRRQKEKETFDILTRSSTSRRDTMSKQAVENAMRAFAAGRKKSSLRVALLEDPEERRKQQQQIRIQNVLGSMRRRSSSAALFSTKWKGAQKEDSSDTDGDGDSDCTAVMEEKMVLTLIVPKIKLTRVTQCAPDLAKSNGVDISMMAVMNDIEISFRGSVESIEAAKTQLSDLLNYQVASVFPLNDVDSVVSSESYDIAIDATACIHQTSDPSTPKSFKITSRKSTFSREQLAYQQLQLESEIQEAATKVAKEQQKERKRSQMVDKVMEIADRNWEEKLGQQVSGLKRFQFGNQSTDSSNAPEDVLIAFHEEDYSDDESTQSNTTVNDFEINTPEEELPETSTRDLSTFSKPTPKVPLASDYEGIIQITSEGCESSGSEPDDDIPKQVKPQKALSFRSKLRTGSPMLEIFSPGEEAVQQTAVDIAKARLKQLGTEFSTQKEKRSSRFHRIMSAVSETVQLGNRWKCTCGETHSPSVNRCQACGSLKQPQSSINSLLETDEVKNHSILSTAAAQSNRCSMELERNWKVLSSSEVKSKYPTLPRNCIVAELESLVCESLPRRLQLVGIGDLEIPKHNGVFHIFDRFEEVSDKSKAHKLYGNRGLIPENIEFTVVAVRLSKYITLDTITMKLMASSEGEEVDVVDHTGEVDRLPNPELIKSPAESELPEGEEERAEKSEDAEEADPADPLVVHRNASFNSDNTDELCSETSSSGSSTSVLSEGSSSASGSRPVSHLHKLVVVDKKHTHAEHTNVVLQHGNEEDDLLPTSSPAVPYRRNAIPLQVPRPSPSVQRRDELKRLRRLREIDIRNSTAVEIRNLILPEGAAREETVRGMMSVFGQVGEVRFQPLEGEKERALWSQGNSLCRRMSSDERIRNFDPPDVVIVKFNSHEAARTAIRHLHATSILPGTPLLLLTLRGSTSFGTAKVPPRALRKSRWKPGTWGDINLKKAWRTAECLLTPIFDETSLEGDDFDSSARSYRNRILKSRRLQQLLRFYIEGLRREIQSEVTNWDVKRFQMKQTTSCCMPSHRSFIIGTTATGRCRSKVPSRFIEVSKPVVTRRFVDAPEPTYPQLMDPLKIDSPREVIRNNNFVKQLTLGISKDRVEGMLSGSNFERSSRSPGLPEIRSKWNTNNISNSRKAVEWIGIAESVPGEPLNPTLPQLSADCCIVKQPVPPMGESRRLAQLTSVVC